MSMLFVPLPGNAVMAKHLAGLADGKVGTLETRRFPDGERYLRFPNDLRDRRVALVCTLDRPDQKIPTLLFAARTARELGARQVGLVAPYLCYMRQDTRFHPGEAVTAHCFAELISADFDWLVTLDPHLHRFTSLSQLYSVPARAAHAGPAIAKWIKDNVERPFLIGPDEESLQWIRPVAKACGGSPFAVLNKERRGDRDVRVQAPRLQANGDATPVLLDDVISTGQTILAALAAVTPQFQRPPVVIAVHGLFCGNARRLLARRARLVTTNSVGAGRIEIAPALAQMIATLP